MRGVLLVVVFVSGFLPLFVKSLFQQVAALFPPRGAENAYWRPALPDMSNMAERIVDMDTQKKVFDFCGGMPFQLVLSDKLKRDLAARKKSAPVVFDASMTRMSKIPDYRQSADADDISVFYGREVRKVPNAAGGRGFVLQLVSCRDDPEGWSAEEVAEYNGWAHDAGRKWRKAADHAAEGNELYQAKFGPSAFGLHHRFYWHLDRSNGLWLAAEDGCEGVVRDW